LKEGIRRSSGEIVIVQDADLEYNPAEINLVTFPIQSGKADVVLGSRLLAPGAIKSFYRRGYYANRLLTTLSNLFTGLRLTDMETCYKAFRGEIIRDMIITSKRFGFEVEVVAKVSKLKCRVCEVPISYYSRSYEEGKKIAFRDGLMALFYIIHYNVFCSREKSFKHPEKFDFR
jgi:glycosyltransferase involved in cell wall biosynthesis